MSSVCGRAARDGKGPSGRRTLSLKGVQQKERAEDDRIRTSCSRFICLPLMEAPALQPITGWTALRSHPAVLKDSLDGPGLAERAAAKMKLRFGEGITMITSEWYASHFERFLCFVSLKFHKRLARPMNKS